MPLVLVKAGGRVGRAGLCVVVCVVVLSLLWGSGAAVSVSRAVGARVTAVRRLDARMLDLTVWSPAVGGSVPVRVVLPAGWGRERGRRFPVLYLLHGGNDDYTSWTRETDVEALARDRGVLVVMPDGGRAGQYSNWYDGGPQWETFHTVELVRLMEREFRAGSGRAVVGLSMGGFGALNYAARHRGLYRYVAAFSPTVDLDDPWIRAYLLLGNVWAGTDVDYSRVWGDPVAQAANWEAHNPVAMVRAYRGMKVHLSVGDGEVGPLDRNPDPVATAASRLEGALAPDVEKFTASLRASGVDVSAHVYSPGTHSWPYWERELHLVWPTVTRELDC